VVTRLASSPTTRRKVARIIARISAAPDASTATGPPPGRSWVRRRVVDPIVALLKQGATPERIALSMAVGACVGVFPVLGTTTVICLVVAWIFRLNVAAIEILNYVVYPLQVALIIPFVRLGEHLVRAAPTPLALPQLVAMFRAGTLHAIGVVWRSLMYASLVWLLVAPLLMAVLYVILLPIVRRVAAVYAAARAKPPRTA
jgi:hypothetical protein